MSLSQVLYHLKEGADQVIETSCAVVILKGTKAYKIKKSVDYGFLDFTSVEKRRAALLRELRYNQRMAADIYLGVEEIAGESVLVMRRFDTGSVLGEQSQDPQWRPEPGLMEDLGRLVARFHAGSEICHDAQHVRNIKYVIDSNSRNIAVFRDGLGAKAVDAYDAAIHAAYADVEAAVVERFEGGHVRHCHGDLHLGNILIENDAPVLFDCIEFNDRLSQIDVLYDLAFLLMDLWVKGLSDAASRVLNVYLEQAARFEGDVHGVYAGLRLLPLYMSVRAGVRCHVHANYGGEGHYALDKARMYLEAAQRFLVASPAEVLAVGGLSGSGKSTHARTLAPDSGRAPGAVILRSDEIRKRLWATPEYEALPPEAYTPDENQRVYNEMFELAQTVARSGQSLVLDATFREAVWRERAETMAKQVNLAFSGVWLDVSPDDRMARIALRSRDVSDATPQVAARQQPVDRASISWAIRR